MTLIEKQDLVAELDIEIMAIQVRLRDLKRERRDINFAMEDCDE